MRGPKVTCKNDCCEYSGEPAVASIHYLTGVCYGAVDGVQFVRSIQVDYGSK